MLKSKKNLVNVLGYLFPADCMWSSIKGICNWDTQETKAHTSTTSWFVKLLQILCAVFLVHVLTGV